jgi:hypothetical protein
MSETAEYEQTKGAHTYYMPVRLRRSLYFMVATYWLILLPGTVYALTISREFMPVLSLAIPFAAFSCFNIGFAKTRLTFDTEGLTYFNGFKRRRVPWATVREIEVIEQEGPAYQVVLYCAKWPRTTRIRIPAWRFDEDKKLMEDFSRVSKDKGIQFNL